MGTHLGYIVQEIPDKDFLLPFKRESYCQKLEANSINFGIHNGTTNFLVKIAKIVFDLNKFLIFFILLKQRDQSNSVVVKFSASQANGYVPGLNPDGGGKKKF